MAKNKNCNKVWIEEGIFEGEMDKFDGKMSFKMWQIRVKDLLAILGYLKALERSPTITTEKYYELSDEEIAWKVKDIIIKCCLADNVLQRVMHIDTAKEMWEEVERLYVDKSFVNKIKLKIQLFRLEMKEDTSVEDHVDEFHRIVFELKAIGVEISDEDLVDHLLISLPPSRNLVVTILTIVRKEPWKLIELERILIMEDERRRYTDELWKNPLEAVGGKKKTDKRNCWRCGQVGHLKPDCNVKKGR